MAKKDVYVPSNITGFKCQMCGECCRIKWDIVMTKGEYEFVRKQYEKKGMLETFDKAFTIINENTPDNYAKLVHDGNKCSLLTENNLCSKQLEFGADALTYICFNYPKKTILTPRGIEVSMYYSCPTALKTLDTDAPICIVKNPEGFAIRHLAEHEFNIDKNLVEFYFLLEDFLLKILQNRKLSIQERLLVLSYIALNTQDINLSQNTLPTILNVFENAQKITESEELLENFNSITSNTQYQITYILSLLNNKENTGLRIIKDSIDKINEIFEIKDGQGDIDGIVDKFLAEYYDKYQPYEKENNNLIENYLCQFIFRREFGNGFINGLYVTGLFYILLRFFAICLCIGKNKKLDKEILFEAIRTIEYGIAHNVYVNEVIEGLRKEKQNEITAIISMFKM